MKGLNLDYLFSIEETTLREFKKGEYLLREGDKVVNLFYLLKGSCNRIETNIFGDEVIYNTKQANQGIYSLIGVNALYTKESRSPSTFIARTEVKCYKINAEKAKSYISQQPEILISLLHMNEDSYDFLKSSFKHRMERTTANFFCNILLKNTVEMNGEIYLKEDLTNLELSQRLGVHQVTVARIMTILKNEKVLERNSKGIQVLKPNCLKEYAEGKKLNYQLS